MGLGYCDLDGEKFSAAVDHFKRALAMLAELRRRDHRAGRGVQAARRSSRGAQLVPPVPGGAAERAQGDDGEEQHSRSRAEGRRRRQPAETKPPEAKPPEAKQPTPRSTSPGRPHRRCTEGLRRGAQEGGRRQAGSAAAPAYQRRAPAVSCPGASDETMSRQEAVTRRRGVLRQGRGDRSAQRSRKERARKMKQEELEELKKQHFMHCPKCGFELRRSSSRGSPSTNASIATARGSTPASSRRWPARSRTSCTASSRLSSART